jgi:hypothetical protein
MAIQGEILANGQLASSDGVLFTAGPGDFEINLLTLHNTTGGALTPTITVKKYGGTARTIYSASLAANTTKWLEFGSPGLTMQEGDAIRGSTSSGAAIDYVVFGKH